ncbi:MULTISPECIES: flagellar hook-basal body complex protein [Clostridium]|uniref:flagellar hook-basal body complex protein n=1 Tax=Clostridium TaxID=1485 RepID=UPI000824CE51|nr:MULTISPECIES: flagellar hook-basal body complex protein [Clostridium]PJI09873.1 flagellar hook protein FlgE [Clostridium sp. CT7]
MSRGMNAGVSALKVFQEQLDIVGNNIANQSTTAYKNQSVNFEDSMNENIKAATGSSTTYGGTNPQQIGTGVDVASITTNTGKGGINTTGQTLDNYIDGDGYFMVASGKNMYDESDCIKVDPEQHTITSAPTGTTVHYTRDGSFHLDADGNLLTAGGYKVLGYSMIGRNSIDPDATSGNKICGDFVSMSKMQDASTANESTATDTVGASKLEDSITAVTNRTAGNHSSDKDDKLYANSGDIVFVDNQDADLRADNTNLHSLKIPKTVRKAYYNTIDKAFEFKDVAVTGFSISGTGLITATLSDNSTAAIGQIATANFTNPAGLNKIGGNLVDPSANSGSAIVKSGYAKAIDGKTDYNTDVTLKDNSGSFGAITSGALESSNVDLAQQFTDMITASRAYEASGKIITTQDEILQKLVNLKQ